MKEKVMKKLAALVLSLTMVLTMGVTAFAAAPSASDTVVVSVENVEKGATVEIYKIADAKYDTAKGGLTGYELRSGYAIADIENPTAAEIAAIGTKIINDGTTATYTLDPASSTPDPSKKPEEDVTTYSKSVPAGMYIVLVKKTKSAKLYNPMVLSAGYTDANDKDTLAGGTVDANSKFDYKTNKAYAKSSPATVEKSITGSNKNDKGNTVGYGDTVNYKIDTAFPSYSPEYKTVTFNIKDTLSKGLELTTSSVVVTVGTQKYAENADTAQNIKELSEIADSVTITKAGIDIKFKSAAVLANELEKVKVEYSATVTKDATSNFNPNTNTAEIEYSNDPTDNTKTEKKDDNTKSYTFGLDSDLGGEDPQGTPSKETEEVKKWGVEKTVTPGTQPEKKPLSGAKFTLYKDQACTKVQPINEDVTGGTAETDANGHFKMTGIPEGTFYFRETKAPAGYVLDSTVHSVKFEATLNTDGTLKSYTVTIDGGTANPIVNKYDATYNQAGEPTVTPSGNNKPLDIINSPLPILPSTGGIGTYLFYMVGAALMVVAVTMLTKKRKVSPNKNK